MTSALRCSDEPLGQRRRLVAEHQGVASTARTMAPASITSVVRLRSRPSPARSTTCCAPPPRRVRPAATGAGTGSGAGLGGSGAGSAEPGVRHRRGWQGSGVATGCGVSRRAPARRPVRAWAPRGGGAWVLRTYCLAGAAAGVRCYRGLTGRNRHVQPGLDALDALQQCRLGVAGRRQQQPRAHHFQQQPRRGRPAHLAQPGMHHLGVPGQGRRYRCGRPAHASGPARPRARRRHPRGSRIRHRLQHDQIAEPLQQVGGEPPRIVAGVDHRLPPRRTAPRRHRRPARRPRRRSARRRWRPAAPAPAGSATLVAARRRPAAGRAPTACRGANRRRRGSPAGYTASSTSTPSAHDPLDQRAHGARRQQPERVVVGARPDGRQHLLRLGGGEHEDQVLGRFLDDLEQRVERPRWSPCAPRRR